MRYEIDLTRCIFCGYCVEVCPKQAIEMTTAYEISEYTREDLLLDLEKLTQPPVPRYETAGQKKAG